MENELDVNPNPSSADFILSQRQGSINRAIGDLDANPDEAARSMELAQATGVPAPVINADLEGFEHQHRATLTASLLNNNDYLRRFIDSNPMAAKVANDDYANLDQISSRISGGFSLWGTAKSSAKALFNPPESFGEGGLGSNIPPEDWVNRPVLSSIASVGMAPVELFARTSNAFITELAGTVLPKKEADQFAQFIQDPGLAASLQGMGPHGAAMAGFAELLSKFKPIEAYLKNNREPQHGILPEFDKAMAEDNAKNLDHLKELTADAQSSLVRERNPDLFADFIRQHTDAEISVSGDAAAALYGDKLPAPDDGLLGWVPDIESKLDLARSTGTDVSIPLADWLTKADPKVLDVLHDDLRVRPNGITAREAQMAAEADTAREGPRPPPLPEEVPTVRAASALEPMFSIGDRNLKLERLAGDNTSKFGPAAGFHDFSINDEKGNPVGTINLSEQNGGKKLYIEMVNGINGLGARDFGPGLMRSILNQLKAEFPNAETLGGFRVSGARKKFNTMQEVEIDLDASSADIQRFSQILEGGQWQTFSPNISAYIRPYAEQLPRDRAIIDIVNQELNRIVPQKVQPLAVEQLEAIRGQSKISPRGAYIQYKEAYPVLLYALEGPDPLGTARHEAIHHLRKYGFFDQNEWSILEKASQDNGWIEKFGIDRRYKDGSSSLKLEESIADAYKDWARGADAPTSEVHSIFEKMKALFEGIKEKLAQLFGKEPSWEDVFKRVDTGEVGAREGKPLDPNAFDEKLSRGPLTQEDFKGGVKRYPGEPDIYTNGEQTLRSPTGYSDQWSLVNNKTAIVEDISATEARQLLNDGNFKHLNPNDVPPPKGVEGPIVYNPGPPRVEDSPGYYKNDPDYEPKTRRPTNVKSIADKYFPRGGALDEKLSVQEDPEGGSRVFERASALGMTVDQFKRYDALIQKRHAEDIADATRRAITEKAREQTKQWKEDRKALRVEVASDIRQRPDVAADLFFGSGELYGKKVPLGSVKLEAAKLTEEQKNGLPRQYYGQHGLDPDDVANLFGYGSGDALVGRLVEYNAAKLQTGMSARDYVSKVIDIETDRQMQQRYGVLEDNIMDAAKEQVASETQLDILHEETHALGMKIGQAPLDKGSIVAQLREQFAKMPLGTVSSDAYLRAAGKAGRAAEDGLLRNDPEAAFRAKQQQYYATVIAKEAVQLEKEIGKFNKVAKQFSKREVPSVDQAYTNFIHDILQRVGRPVRRSVQDIATEVAAGEYKSLQDFVEGKNGFYLREVAVSGILFDPGFRKEFENLTVDEFRAVDTSIKSMVKNGRDEKKITKAGAEADLAEIKGQMLNQIHEFDEKEFDAKGQRGMGPIPKQTAHALRTFGIDHLQMEAVLNRWDKGDPNGVFQQYVMRDLVDAANSESAKRKVYAARLLELDDKADLKASVDNTIFKAPGTQQNLPLTRANLRAILLNVGNKINLTKLAKGYDLKSEQVMAWLHRYATKEDWDWAQKMGDIFADLKAEADVMYRNLSGVAPGSRPIEPIDTPHGQYKGWYYPLIAHPEFEGGSRKMMGKNALEQEGFVRASVPNGYTKDVTGAIYPLALDLDMLPYRMGQMIHDVEMRPAVVNASKIFYDKEIRQAIANRIGTEWRDMLVPYLVDVANVANYTTKAQAQMASWSEFFRQNLITTLVGLNPGTFMKHTPTALIQSIREVGTQQFLQAVRGLWSVNERTGESNWKFAIDTSQELQRRHSHFMETLGGAADTLVPEKGFASLRQTVNYYASYPVAMGDLASAVPTWLAEYTRQIEEGATHGDAAYMGDRAVRRAHGSTAITNRSAVMRGGAYSPWLASVYGFFNHIMNRQYEMLWKSGEMLDMIKDGDKSAAMKAGAGLTASLFAYVLAPAIIEELVQPQQSQPGDSWGKKAAKGLTFTLAASWIGIRDLANAILNGRDPTIGLLGSQFKPVTDTFRDLAKDQPLSKAHAGKLIRDATTLAGVSTGLVPAQAGRVAQFTYGVGQGTERPKGPWGWMTGMRYGTIDKHPKTFQEWQRHHIGGH